MLYNWKNIITFVILFGAIIPFQTSAQEIEYLSPLGQFNESVSPSLKYRCVKNAVEHRFELYDSVTRNKISSNKWTDKGLLQSGKCDAGRLIVKLSQAFVENDVDSVEMAPLEADDLLIDAYDGEFILREPIPERPPRIRGLVRSKYEYLVVVKLKDGSVIEGERQSFEIVGNFEDTFDQDNDNWIDYSGDISWGLDSLGNMVASGNTRGEDSLLIYEGSYHPSKRQSSINYTLEASTDIQFTCFTSPCKAGLALNFSPIGGHSEYYYIAVFLHSDGYFSADAHYDLPRQKPRNVSIYKKTRVKVESGPNDIKVKSRMVGKIQLLSIYVNGRRVACKGHKNGSPPTGKVGLLLSSKDSGGEVAFGAIDVYRPVEVHHNWCKYDLEGRY